MFERILVTTDGSPFANLALPVAADLARRYGATLTVLHVVPGPVALTEGAAYAFDYDTERRRQLALGQQILEEAKARIDLPGVQLISREGLRTDEIIAQEVGRGAFQLVVMSTHGRSGLAHFFLGSVAEGLLRRVQVPVFLVRAPEPATAHGDTVHGDSGHADTAPQEART
ncbi:universal stress protein [Deinococcus koreensis]|nr:universal stress protein [Deinococcus koreensis]